QDGAGAGDGSDDPHAQPAASGEGGATAGGARSSRRTRPHRVAYEARRAGDREGIPALGEEPEAAARPGRPSESARSPRSSRTAPRARSGAIRTPPAA